MTERLNRTELNVMIVLFFLLLHTAYRILVP